MGYGKAMAMSAWQGTEVLPRDPVSNAVTAWIAFLSNAARCCSHSL